MSYTNKTIKHLSAIGYSAQSVEMYNPFSKKRRDLFGFIDVVAVNPDLCKCVGLQITSRSNVSTRVKKIMSEKRDNAKAWLKAGNEIFVIGWNNANPNNTEARVIAIQEINGELTTAEKTINL